MNNSSSVSMFENSSQGGGRMVVFTVTDNASFFLQTLRVVSTTLLACYVVGVLWKPGTLGNQRCRVAQWNAARYHCWWWWWWARDGILDPSDMRRQFFVRLWPWRRSVRRMFSHRASIFHVCRRLWQWRQTAYVNAPIQVTQSVTSPRRAVSLPRQALDDRAIR